MFKHFKKLIYLEFLDAVNTVYIKNKVVIISLQGLNTRDEQAFYFELGIMWGFKDLREVMLCIVKKCGGVYEGF